MSGMEPCRLLRTMKKYSLRLFACAATNHRSTSEHSISKRMPLLAMTAYLIAASESPLIAPSFRQPTTYSSIPSGMSCSSSGMKLHAYFSKHSTHPFSAPAFSSSRG